MDGLSAPPLITAEELHARLSEPDVTLLDATTTWPGGPQPRVSGSIPGATFFDIAAIADPDSKLPHMLPSPEAFAAAVEGLGVSSGDLIVVYDRHGVLTAPRAWWSFRAMGHNRVAVLDGGLPGWIDEGLPTDPAAPAAAAASPGRFQAKLVTSLVRSFDEMRATVKVKDAQILDARSHPRFTGAEKEARRGLRAGHMPGARNVPYKELMTSDGRLAPPADLERVLKARGASLSGPVVTTCGSGVTACIIALAYARTGRWDVPVYDGSWAEWGGRRGAPVKKGAGE